jgi:hypothetical protein
MSPRTTRRLGFLTKTALLLLVATAGCANPDEVSIIPPPDANGEATPDAPADAATEPVGDSKTDKGTVSEDPGVDVKDSGKDVPEAGEEDADASAEAAADGPQEAEAGEDAQDAADAEEAEAGCTSAQKLCASVCVGKNDPTYGCTASDCTPCALDHATAGCSIGACVVTACDTGYANCDNDASNGCEVDTTSDPLHCGTCLKGCSFAHAIAGCTGGSCTLGACDANFENCDSDPANGCEADLQNNPKTCGNCATECLVSGGTPVCNSGVCGSSGCNAGLGDCDSNVAGCETDITTSLAHCGYCNHACSFPNATAKCEASQCKLDACTSGFLNCDGNEANGCEVNAQTDPDHCGSCTQWCAGVNVIPTCSGGACQMVCTTGYGNCNGYDADGCETPLNTAYACGSCTNKCQPANGVGACNAGICGVAACNTGYGDCNGQVSDGCEINVYADVLHCGNCTTACSTNHAAPTCNGTCQLTCDSGWANCNNLATDGCEAAVSNDPQHCGGCTNVCPSVPNATATCNGTTCGFVCSAGWADCDGNAANGCEVSTETDPTHCGSCTNVCATPPNGTASCVLSACTMTCNAGFGNCDGNAANGCEANLSSDSQHCGSCTTTCGTFSCSSGQCTGVSCTPPMADCDGITGNGCEVNLNTDSQHCGSCTKQCTGTQACAAGACVAASHINCIGAGCTTTLAGQNLGQSFTNASPVGNPGTASTYNQQMATDAANAWMPGAGTLVTGTCDGAPVVGKQLTKSCAIWVYGGTYAGYLLYNSTKLTGNQYCACPTTTDLSWR